MPPWRKYSTSVGVSILTRAVNSTSPARTLTVRAAPPSMPPDRDRRLAGEPERGGALAVRELERQDAHADQVGPVDALEGPRDHRAHPEQRRAFGRPVA